MNDSQSGLHLSSLTEILKDSITSTNKYFSMVLSIVDQHKPKCYLCHDTFENMEELRKHQESVHKDFVEYHKNRNDRSPAPGDVTVF